MLKIDAWTHILPKPYLAHLDRVPSGPGAGILRSFVQNRGLSNLEDRLRMMDRFPDYKQILMSVPSELMIAGFGDSELVQELMPAANDAMAELVATLPDRFAGFAAMVPMHTPDQAVSELERAITQLGAVGIQIETNIEGVPLDDPRYEAVLARMEQLERPIWIHPARTPAWSDYPTETRSSYALWQIFGWPYETTICLSRLIFSGLMERYPMLRIIAHHGGGMIPHFSGRIGSFLQQEGPNLDGTLGVALQSLKKPAIEYYKQFYVDTAMFGAKHAVDCVIDFFGVDHVLFASDSPFDPEHGPGFIRETIADIDSLQLSEVEQLQVYGGNARRVLGIS